MNPLVDEYLNRGYRLVFWPQIGDKKGPQQEGWTSKAFTREDYRDGYRVGILTGQEISSNKFLHDIDIDWSPGIGIAAKLLPKTQFIFGRSSKYMSHCFYTTPEPITSFRFEDVDKTVLIEIRGVKSDGTIGMQTMVPPSVWSKEGAKELLEFRRPKDSEPSWMGDPTFYEVDHLKKWVTLTSISVLLAKHFGKNGFGHEARLSWAGFLLRLGVDAEDLIKCGEVMSSEYCNNLEINDVRTVVESTLKRIRDKDKAVRGAKHLAGLIGSKGKAVVQRIVAWLGGGRVNADTNGFVCNKDGKPLQSNLRNIRRAIELFGIQVAHNTFIDIYDIKEGEHARTLNDNLLDDLQIRCEEEFGFQPSIENLDRVIRHIGRDFPFHPVKDYLNGLTWDGTPRLDEWLVKYAGAKDTDYVRAVSAIVLIAAVHRVRCPGCKYDEMLVLEGEQGLNKSSTLRALCQDESWFSDDLSLNSTAQKVIEATNGKWIIEAADLAGKRKAEVEQLKAMLSRQVDRARMAYARLAEDKPRQFIIIGTTNSTAYLTDTTGARRFWPIQVSRMDVVGLRKIRDQLWAEAASREAAGESIRLREDLWEAAGVEQEARREADPWEDPISNWLYNVAPKKDGLRRVHRNAIYEALNIDAGRRSRADAMRVTEIMHRLGYKKKSVDVDGVVGEGFVELHPTQLPLE